MKVPNFFIIGAPKCGTTALVEYLRTHPNIYLPEIKEPHYFAKDLENYRIYKSLQEYMAIFQNADENQRAIGEGSVFYLYSSTALQNIYKFNPDAKIIVMLRNPVDLVYSFHSQLLFSRDEEEKDFQAAWNLQKIRKKNREIPRLCREAKLLQYADIGKLGKQVEKLLTIFPPEQIKIIFFEDFQRKTQQIYQEVLDFLAVTQDYRLVFEKINENKLHKVNWLADFSEKTPEKLVKVAMGIKETLGIERLGILDKIRSLNTQVKTRPPLDINFRRELIEEFQPEIAKLSAIVNRDLNSWTI